MSTPSSCSPSSGGKFIQSARWLPWQDLPGSPRAHLFSKIGEFYLPRRFDCVSEVLKKIQHDMLLPSNFSKCMGIQTLRNSKFDLHLHSHSAFMAFHRSSETSL